MGHDISAYYDKHHMQHNTDSICSFERGAFNTLNAKIYEALDAMKHYGSVSGLGAEQLFSEEQLKKALSFLVSDPESRELKKEIQFITECLNNLNPEKKVLISFY